MQTAINRQECTIKIYAKNFLPSSNMKTMTTCPVKIMGYPAFDDFLYLYNENRYAKIIGKNIQEINRCTTHCCWRNSGQSMVTRLPHNTDYVCDTHSFIIQKSEVIYNTLLHMKRFCIARQCLCLSDMIMTRCWCGRILTPRSWFSH